MIDYTTDRFFDFLYKKRPDAGLLSAENEAVLDERIAQKRAQLRRVTGLEKLDALGHTPVWQTLNTRAAEGYTVEEAAVETLPGLYTPVYILTPTQPYTHSFIYAHGHGKGAEEVVDTRYADGYQYCLPLTLARKYRVYVPELMGFNRVVSENFNQEYERGCYANSTRLLMHGLTMTAVRVYQVLQIIDRINRETGVKPVIGGISGGGLVAAFTAALGPDICGTFISCYANTFRDSIMSLHHCVDNFIPDIFSVGEEPDIMALACPAPLLISAGSEDPIFPITAAREAAETVRCVYAKKNAADQVRLEVFEGDHRISTAALLPWLESLA